MSLLSSLIGVADNLTKSFGLQSDVSYEAYTSSDDTGRRFYAPVVARKALVVKKQRMVKTTSGDLVLSEFSVTFIDPTVVNPLDRITLADGSTGPILVTDGFVDASNAPILTEIFFG